jgi:hypothetical protein
MAKSGFISFSNFVTSRTYSYQSTDLTIVFTGVKLSEYGVPAHKTASLFTRKWFYIGRRTLCT